MRLLTTFGAGNGAAKADATRTAEKIEYFMIVATKRSCTLGSDLEALAAEVKGRRNTIYLAANSRTGDNYLYLRRLKVGTKMSGVSLGKSSYQYLPGYRSFVDCHMHSSNIFSGYRIDDPYQSSVQQVPKTTRGYQKGRQYRYPACTRFERAFVVLRVVKLRKSSSVQCIHHLPRDPILCSVLHSLPRIG